MKKSLLTLVFAGAGVLFASAQAFKAPLVEKFSQEAVKPVAEKKVQGVQQAFAAPYGTSAVVFKNAQAVSKAQKKAASISPCYNMLNALYDGIYDEGWYSLKTIYTPALTDGVFDLYGIRDATDPVITWKLESQAGTDASDKITTDEYGDGIVNIWGYYMAPEVTVTSGSETATFHDTFNYSGTDHQAYLQAGCDSLLNFANLFVSDNVYRGFTDLPNTFAFNQNFYETGKKTKSVAEYFAAPSNQVYTEGLYFLVYSENATASAPFGGKSVTATVYTFNDESGLVPYATATATDENVTAYGNGLYYVSFKFMDHDDILGDVEAPITLPQEDFIVIIDGFDELSASFVPPFGGADGFTGFGYAVLEDGSLATIPYSNSDTPQVSLHIGLENAAIPVAELMDPEQVVEFPVEGGLGITGTGEQEGQPVQYNDVDVYTMFDAESWEVAEAPEWITKFSLDDSYLENYGVMAFYFEAEALPAGLEGRTGEIILVTNFNKEVVIPIKQGNAATAVEGVKVSGNAKMTDGLLFNVAGQQVNKNYKGIVIKDGRKFIQK